MRGHGTATVSWVFLAMVLEHHHHELDDKLDDLLITVTRLETALVGDNGLPGRVRALESWKGRVSGQTVLLAGLLAAAVAVGAALIARL